MDLLKNVVGSRRAYKLQLGTYDRGRERLYVYIAMHLCKTFKEEKQNAILQRIKHKDIH